MTTSPTTHLRTTTYLTDEGEQLVRVDAHLQLQDAGRFSRMAVMFDQPVTDEDDQLTIGALLGYAWRIHGDATYSGTLTDTLFDWQVPNVVVFDAPMYLRRRGHAAATGKLVDAITAMVEEGSPMRRSGDRLVEPPATPVKVTAVYVGC